MDVFIDLILSKLKQSFNNPEFSDVRIVSASATFYAHKLILTRPHGQESGPRWKSLLILKSFAGIRLRITWLREFYGGFTWEKESCAKRTVNLLLKV